MPEYPKDPSLAAWMAEMERRVAAVERAPRLTNASITDANGVERVVLGLLDEATNDYGFEVYDGGGVLVYQASADGVTYPRTPLFVAKSSDNVVVTSGTFAPKWDLTVPYAVADAFHVQAVVAADAATTAEVRLSANIGGTVYAATQAVPAASANAYEWKWAPPGLAVGSGPVVLGVEVRRVSGAGNVYSYVPIQAHMTTAASIGATATGV